MINQLLPCDKLKRGKMNMNNISVYAQVQYAKIDTNDYIWKKFTVPVYGGKYQRGVTNWEQECLDTANGFLDELFSVPGFLAFFANHHYCVPKGKIVAYLHEHGSDLVFPVSREYWQPFSWEWCQHEGGRNSIGHIMDTNGWFYDKLAAPSISVTIDGREYKPFDDWECCFSSCEDNDNFAWRLCEASSYNVPYLYSLIRACNFNTEYLYEGGFTADMDSGLMAVLKFFDEEVLPTYDIIINEDNAMRKAGTYPMHIVDLSSDNLRCLVRNNKKRINKILEDHI